MANPEIVRCTNCGREAWTRQTMAGEPPARPDGWRKGGFFSSNLFCSDRCKSEYDERHSKVKKSELFQTEDESPTFFSTDQRTQSEPISEEEMKLQLEKMRYKQEKEERERQIEKEKEEEAKKKLEEDRQKASQLKNEGKKWLSLWYWVGQNGRYGIGAGILIFLFVGIGATQDGDAIGLGVISFCFAFLGLVFSFLVLKDSLSK